MKDGMLHEGSGWSTVKKMGVFEGRWVGTSLNGRMGLRVNSKGGMMGMGEMRIK